MLLLRDVIQLNKKYRKIICTTVHCTDEHETTYFILGHPSMIRA